ncbi:MAG: 50S ribosomal protein L32e [Candidatus Helarchaeota archaeon]
MSDLERLLKLRAQIKKSRPKFRRYESWRYKRIKLSWRRSRGIDSKVRRKKKGNIVSPNIGYRGPRKTRYLHSSGFEEVIVHNMRDLEKVNPRKQVVKIAGKIGRNKRIMMQDRADELDILILNRTRILLPGEELLMEEGRGFEHEAETFEEIPGAEADVFPELPEVGEINEPTTESDITEERASEENDEED